MPNPPLNNFDALLKLSSEHEPVGGSKGGLEEEISHMNTGYFSKLFTMLSLDTQPRRRFKLSYN